MNGDKVVEVLLERIKNLTLENAYLIAHIDELKKGGESNVE